MKYILTICLFFTSAIAFAQVDSVSLKEAMSNLDKALINKDQKALVQLLHQDVSYGHSNGWVQNNKWATVRINTNAEGKGNGNSFQFKLHVLQVWLKAKSGWQLLARQSTKL